MKIERPAGLVDGGTCGTVTVVGCCDAEGHSWWCAENLDQLNKDLCF